MGAKKKTLANRLANMTDEERARYLQHKADQEEEAKKRKEQLIATFMKNKIKREDGFSRLNLAKLNQHWHQLLRYDKCKGMREEVEHLKKYIDRVLDHKNRTIRKLVEELEMADEQYSHNFKAHYTHIDQIIAAHEKYMLRMEEEFQKDLEQLLDVSKREYGELIHIRSEQQSHLKTVIFCQKSRATNAAKDDYERYLKRKEELTSTSTIQLETFVKSRERHLAALWRQIGETVRAHVTEADTRRHHYAELKRLDAESAAEITANQDRITSQEEEIVNQQKQSEQLERRHTKTIERLRKSTKKKAENLHSARRHFRNEVDTDEKKLISLTTTSNRSIDHLNRIRTKGSQIVSLTMTCKKFETQREQIAKFLPRTSDPNVTIDQEEMEEIKMKWSGKSKDGEKETVKKIVISAKSPPSSSSASCLGDSEVVKDEFGLLDQMENFWVVYSQVELDLMDLKQEKKELLEENKQLRGTIRAALEAAVLDRSTPKSKVSTRVGSKRNGPASAPLTRILV